MNEPQRFLLESARWWLTHAHLAPKGSAMHKKMIARAREQITKAYSRQS